VARLGVTGPSLGHANNCSQAGHWKRDCPKLARGGGGGRGQGGGGGRNFESRGRNNGQQQPKPFTKGPSSWKTTPPGPRYPKEKMVADRKFFWCDKCTRWSTSHLTTTHVAKAPDVHVAPAAPTANLVPFFGNFSWCVPIEATKLWDPTTTSTARKALTTRASRKADAKGHRQAAKAALQPTSKVFHAAARAPKAPREAQLPKASKAPHDAKLLKAIVEPINKDPSVSYELLRLLGWFSLGIGYSLALLSSSVDFRWLQATTTAGCAWFVENKDHLAPSASWFGLLLLGLKLPWLLAKCPTRSPTKPPTYNAGDDSHGGPSKSPDNKPPRHPKYYRYWQSCLNKRPFGATSLGFHRSFPLRCRNANMHQTMPPPRHRFDASNWHHFGQAAHRFSNQFYQFLAELEQPRSPRRKLYQKPDQVRPYEFYKVISPPLMSFRDRLTDRSPKIPRVNP
jgi:Zinc knuckle